MRRWANVWRSPYTRGAAVMVVTATLYLGIGLIGERVARAESGAELHAESYAAGRLVGGLAYLAPFVALWIGLTRLDRVREDRRGDPDPADAARKREWDDLARERMRVEIRETRLQCRRLRQLIDQDRGYPS